MGELVEVLVEELDDEDGPVAIGRALHQGPDVDGTTRLPAATLKVGDVVEARVVASEGVDLLAEPLAR